MLASQLGEQNIKPRLSNPTRSSIMEPDKNPDFLLFQSREGSLLPAHPNVGDLRPPQQDEENDEETVVHDEKHAAAVEDQQNDQLPAQHEVGEDMRHGAGHPAGVSADQQGQHGGDAHAP